MALSFNNNPRSIDQYPIILTKGADGILRAVPPKQPRTEAYATSPAPEPVFSNVPQVVHFVSSDGVLGVSLGISRNLLKGGLYNMSRALEILADAGKLGTVLLRTEFLRLLSKAIGPKAARNAYDEFSGKFVDMDPMKVGYKHHLKRSRKKFSEFLPKNVPIKVLSNIERTKKGTNSSKRGRVGEGRPSNACYIPTEGELQQLLIKSGLACSADPDFNQWTDAPLKPHAIMKSAADYKAFVMYYALEVGDHTRKEIASKIGSSIHQPRNYAKRLQVKVTQNPLKITPIKDELVKTLPLNEDALRHKIASKLIPEGRHIIAGTSARDKKFMYTQEGAAAAKAASKSGRISQADYTMNSYDITESPYFKQVRGDRNYPNG